MTWMSQYCYDHNLENRLEELWKYDVYFLSYLNGPGEKHEEAWTKAVMVWWKAEAGEAQGRQLLKSKCGNMVKRKQCKSPCVWWVEAALLMEK